MDDAKLGRAEEANAAARVLELQHDFTISGLCSSFGMHACLAGPLSEAFKIARSGRRRR